MDAASPQEQKQHAIARAVFRCAPGERDVHIERVFSSLGAGNLIAYARDRKNERYVLKTRAARSLNAQAEAWGLKNAARAAKKAPAQLAVPALHFITSPMARLEAAYRQGQFALLDILEHSGGDALCTAFVDGEHPVPNIENAERMGRATAALHAVRPKTGPSLRTGSHPRRLIQLAQQLVRELGQRRAVSDTAHKALVAVGKHVSDRVDMRAERVRTLCHGDLRWHNAIVSGNDGPVTLFDFEHSGLGEPVLDLAFFIARGELTDLETLALLDGYTSEKRGDKAFLNRLFGLLPLCRFLSALFGAGDLLRVSDGRRATSVDAQMFIRGRKRDTEATLLAAVTRLMPPGRKPKAIASMTLKLPKAHKRSTSPRRVTVDGTAGSGKSVLAGRAAAVLGAPHVNVGAGYRALTLLALHHGWGPKRAADQDALLHRLKQDKLTLRPDGGASVAGADYHAALSLWAIERDVAQWAQHDAIRDVVDKALRRALGKKGRIVVEGRAAGSVYVPDADLMFYIDADAKVRGERVASRLGIAKTPAVVTKALQTRDALDAGRSRAPLVCPPGAKRINTSTDTLTESVQKIVRLVDDERAPAKSPKRSSGARRPRKGA